MSKIFLIALLVIAVGFLFETRRKNAAKALAKPAALPGQNGQQGSYVTADEAGTTETGKFRVEKLMSKNPGLRPGSKVKDGTHQEQKTLDSDEDEGSLPDPFESKK